ncbi:MAG: ATP-binding protein [Alphaproteobacteria bacterium]|nr:MAG: ATP-binding protein [Alphaproteobacteria bacterium]
MAALAPEQAEALLHDWHFWARPEQLPPEGDWFCWLVVAGRGFGKSRTGAEWVRSLVEGTTPLGAPAHAARIALVADTFADARDVMVEGESGLLAITPRDRRPLFEPSRRRLLWPNGARAFLYSAADPEQLRGPQHHAAWADEIAKWHDGERAWSNLLLGLRLGRRPRVVATTTPRPLAWIRALAEEPTTVVTRGSTYANRAHLPPQFIREVERLYAGTRLGRQELDGVFLDAHEGALWSPEMVDPHRLSAPPAGLVRIVVGVDPPAGHGEDADACGIVVAARDERGHFHVLEDASITGLSPLGWAGRVVHVYHRHGADRIVAEANQGGDMVEAVLRQVDRHVSVRLVRASRGKLIRAEPIAALYERGLVHHVGRFPELEEELYRYTGEPGEKSPDRLDALVWALSALALAPAATPSLRRI